MLQYCFTAELAVPMRATPASALQLPAVIARVLA
jgi:hypothetical protein